jgi:uncharacterized protein (UPF0276 family)
MHFPGKARLPKLGVGLSFRNEIADVICAHAHELDFAELIVDNELSGFLDARFWTRIAATLPLVAHGINATLGSLADLDVEYLKRVAGVARRMRCGWFSEHLAFTQSEGVDSEQLTPVQFSERNAAFVADKINRLCDLLEFPVLIENISYYFVVPGSTLSELEFVLRILAMAHCGLLLDVNNLYANAINHGFDAYEYLDRLPESAVVEIHVAGGESRDGLYVDTHGHAVNDEVMQLLDYAIATKKPNAVLLEREKNFPPVEELLGELRALRGLWVRHLGPVPERRLAACG